MSYQIEYSYSSDIGLKRSRNQDNFCISGSFMPEGCIGTNGLVSGTVNASANSLFAIFDGMGGEERGEAASFIAACTAAQTRFSSDIPNDFYSFVARANRKICDFASENMLRSCGSTAAMLLFDENKIHLCNIGDSKIFRISGSAIEQISVDHLSKAQPGRKAPLSQCLGIPESEMKIIPNVSHLPAAPEDRFLICSDGLTDMVSPDEIMGIVSSNGVEQAVNILLARALENGGRDNITVCLCRIVNMTAGKNAAKTKRNVIIGAVSAILALALAFSGYYFFIKTKEGENAESEKQKSRTEIVLPDRLPFEEPSEPPEDEPSEIPYDIFGDLPYDIFGDIPSEIFDIPSDEFYQNPSDGKSEMPVV